MKTVGKFCAAALMLGGSAFVASQPANAGVTFSIGLGGPAWYGPYRYDAPCDWYRNYDLPVPYRCYGYYQGIWGPNIYVDGDFIFPDRDHWWRWHDRDDYRHWHDHDWAFYRDRDGRWWDHGHEWHGEGHDHDWDHGHGDWDHHDHDWDHGHGDGDHHDHDGDHHDHDHDGDHHDHDHDGDHDH